MEFDSEKLYRKLPVVVLAGRPNVGKSTLFNRLLRRRRSITDPTPGVTRDPVEADAFILGKPMRLVDTGGFKLERDDLDDLVVEKTRDTLARADLVILVLEAGEPTPEDEQFIEYLRQYRDRLMVVVNKTEGGRREAMAWNYMSFGFDDLLMVSAEHGDNIADLEEAIVARLDFSKVEENDDATRPVRIALIGKPNTGKSTLSNRLTASDASIVSPVPGTTRDVVEGSFVYKNRTFAVLDTAGIRRKNKVTENVEYYSVNRAIKTLDEADLVFLMIDAKDGLTEQDKKIAALAHERGRGIVFVLNKWDQMPEIKNAFEAACDRLHFLFGQMEYAPIIQLSALTGEGVDKLLDVALRMYAQLTKPVDTGPLNQALEKWLAEFPPPIGPRTRFKIRYATQVSVNPIKFVFFVSRPEAVGDPYVAYLRNKVRKDLGYGLIPIDIELRSSRKDPAAARKDREEKREAANRADPGRRSGGSAADAAFAAGEAEGADREGAAPIASPARARPAAAKATAKAVPKAVPKPTGGRATAKKSGRGGSTAGDKDSKAKRPYARRRPHA
jgi:GTP-binding protein